MSSKRPLHVVSTDGTRPTPKRLRILIADDDRDTATMLALILRDEGHEVQVVLRGDEALEISRRIDFWARRSALITIFLKPCDPKNVIRLIAPLVGGQSATGASAG